MAACVRWGCPNSPRYSYEPSMSIRLPSTTTQAPSCSEISRFEEIQPLLLEPVDSAIHPFEKVDGRFRLVRQAGTHLRRLRPRRGSRCRSGGSVRGLPPGLQLIQVLGQFVDGLKFEQDLRIQRLVGLLLQGLGDRRHPQRVDPQLHQRRIEVDSLDLDRCFLFQPGDDLGMNEFVCCRTLARSRCGGRVDDPGHQGLLPKERNGANALHPSTSEVCHIRRAGRADVNLHPAC